MEHFLGVHCSVSGGLENAFGEANGLHIDVMQVFTRNQRQWNAKPISDEETHCLPGHLEIQPDKSGLFSLLLPNKLGR